MANTFSDLLKRRRAERQLSRKALADACKIHVSNISLFENDTSPRRPRLYRVQQMAEALLLTFEQRNEFLSAAGYKPIERDADMEINRILASQQLNNLAPREKDLLLGELKEYVIRWKGNREARRKDVQKAIIVAAGWQSHLLAPDQMEAMILHAAMEAQTAEIGHVVIVIAPTRSIPQFERVRKTGLEVSIVIQEEPLGLGHAILVTRSAIGEEPFAVILPVDVDPARAALKKMKDAYTHTFKPIVAVNPEKTVANGESKHYGLAVLGNPSKDAHHLYHVKKLQEKRTIENENPQTRIIIGRYVLTPDVFEELQLRRVNAQTQKIELTDALEEFRKKNHVVCAYMLDKALLPLASVRAIFEVLIHSINDPNKLAEMIELARKTLREAERISNS